MSDHLTTDTANKLNDNSSTRQHNTSCDDVRVDVDVDANTTATASIGNGTANNPAQPTIIANANRYVLFPLQDDEIWKM